MLYRAAHFLAVLLLAPVQAPPGAPAHPPLEAPAQAPSVTPGHAPPVLQKSVDVEAVRALRVDVSGADVAVVGPLGRNPTGSSQARVVVTTSDGDAHDSADAAAGRPDAAADASGGSALDQRGWTIEVVEGELRIVDGAGADAADEPTGTEAGDEVGGTGQGAAVAGAEPAAEGGAAAADAETAPPPRPILRISLPLSLSLDVTTRGGAISVDGIEASVRLRSHGGAIRLGHVRGSAIDVDSAGGPLQAGRLEGEHIRLASAAGRLDVGVTTAPVVAESTGGHIVLRVTGTGEIEATSDSGHVVVGLAGELTDLAARLDVHGAQVVLGKGLPLEAFLRKTEATGKVGPGGPRLRAHSATGCALVGTVRDVETWVRQGVLERGCGVVSEGS